MGAGHRSSLIISNVLVLLPAFLLLLISQQPQLLTLAAMADPPVYCPAACESELKMVVYLHDIRSGPNKNFLIVLNPNFGQVGFGSITVNDYAILDAPEPNATLVATAKGTAVNADLVSGAAYHASFTIVFTNGRFKGSTLEVLGISSVGERAIAGGTGELAFARGTIKYETVKNVPNVESYLKLTIHALYTPPAAITGAVDSE